MEDELNLRYEISMCHDMITQWEDMAFATVYLITLWERHEPYFLDAYL